MPCNLYPPPTLQLPPTILSAAAAKGGLARTMFERLSQARPEATAMLTVQYRMHDTISSWASQVKQRGWHRHTTLFAICACFCKIYVKRFLLFRVPTHKLICKPTFSRPCLWIEGHVQGRARFGGSS